MNRRLKKIGTAIFDIVGFINFRLQETKGNCWIDQLYDKDYWGKNNQSKEINNEIKEYLNKGREWDLGAWDYIFIEIKRWLMSI